MLGSVVLGDVDEGSEGVQRGGAEEFGESADAEVVAASRGSGGSVFVDRREIRGRRVMHGGSCSAGRLVGLVVDLGVAGEVADDPLRRVERIAVAQVRGRGDRDGAFGVDARKPGRCSIEVNAVARVADLDDTVVACRGGGKEAGSLGGVPTEDMPNGRDRGNVQVGQGLSVEIGQALGDGRGR